MSPTLKGRYVNQSLGDRAQNSPETQESFKGEIIHTSEHTSARNNAGKKVVVIGAGVSAHDVAADHVENGVGEVVCHSSISQPRGSNILTGFQDNVPTEPNPCDNAEERHSASHQL